jgi:glucose-1-phosphate cytidylyltransferase
VEKIEEMTRSNLRINSGYFVLRKDIFNYIREGEELVREPFQRLIRERLLVAYEYDGFFQAMDTFKDRQQLEGLLSSGHAPWEVWKARPDAGSHSSVGNGKGSHKGQKSRAGHRHA